ncbi:hypothetical protein [Stenotrophomonas maltophilia]|uniref:hypothetical protein n=1 Tax=Stenotrophomonas maltophilia TaxID=40324 RepID=UPI00106F7323|nr:hypothetical protein [Stenotrophomonas maltophilia]
MSNDNKTLADVQPGGRVRLGDQLPPLPNPWYRPSSSNAPFDLDLYSEGQMRDYARAALSAQPSPGGQDVLGCIGRIEEAIEFRVPHDIYAAVHGELAELKAALAARQPVGEPAVVAHRYIQRHQSAEHSVWLNGDADETYVEAERQGLGRIERAYATPPAQAMDLGAMRALLQRRIEQWRSHLPADPGAPGTREIETKGEPDYNNDVRIYREGIAVMEEVLSKIDSRTVQTAQAVDLDDFKALYRAYVRLLESGRDRIRDLGGTCDPVDVMEANDVDLQAARRVLDSQAVGNG